MDAVNSTIYKFNEDFESYYQGLRVYVKSIVRDHHSAQDIVYETYLKVHTALQKTKKKASSRFYIKLQKKRQLMKGGAVYATKAKSHQFY